MTTKQRILTSLSPILADMQFVRIDDDRVRSLAQELLSEPIPSWDHDQQFLGTPEETALYYFFVDSINFCFWARRGEERWAYRIDDVWTSGYYAYSRAIKDAFLRDPRLFDAAHLSTISEEEFATIFAAGKNELLLLKERHEIIRENFRILHESFGGSVLSLLARAGHDTDAVVSLLVETFPTFNDSVLVDGHNALFLKRAQIFVSDLSFTGLPELSCANLDHLTVFADYKLPQILESIGVLVYDPSLTETIESEALIPARSREEIELRAATIVAIEAMRDEMERLGRSLTTNELDWILWVKAKGTTFAKPHHKTLTTFY